MEEALGKAIDGPIKKSINSVFDGVNSYTEALDFFKSYQRQHFKSVREVVSEINILGMSSPISLESIYTPTKVSTTIHRRLYEQDWVSITDKNSITRKREKKGKVVSALGVVEEKRKVLILGAPGAGKTTFSKYFALANIDRKIFKKSGLKRRYFPFYVSLPSMSGQGDDVRIEDFLIEKIKRSKGEHAEHYVRRKLGKSSTVVLLDSLDEVPEKRKSSIIKKINEFCSDYCDVKLVVTCRVSDYRGGLESFNEFEIARLEDGAIQKIVKAWFPGEKKKSSLLLQHLKADKDVYSLTETPLLLSLLCIQFRHDLNIPTRKTELYRRCIDALLRTWDTSRDFRRDTNFSSLSDDRKEKIFEHVSYYFIEKGFSYLFSREELLKVVAEKLEKYDGIDSGVESEVLDEIECHHGIIERYSMEACFFSHPSFQEYFAAKALISKRKEMDFVKKYQKDARAYSIIPFAASLTENPMPMLKHIMSCSDMSGIKTYPAMAKRTDVLYLLYRCINAGVAISAEDRKILHSHLLDSQKKMSKIYSEGGVYPVAVLERDGIKHAYYYKNKRQTLYEALQPFRRFANEILLSPCDKYADLVISEILGKEISGNDIFGMCDALCLALPVASSRPDAVGKILENYDKKIRKGNVFMKDIISQSLQNLEFYR